MDDRDVVEAEFSKRMGAAVAAASLEAQGINCVIERQDWSARPR